MATIWTSRSRPRLLPSWPYRPAYGTRHAQGLLGWWPGTDPAVMQRQMLGADGQLDDGSVRVDMPATQFGRRAWQFDGSSTWMYTSAAPSAVRIATPLVSAWVRSEVASAVNATVRSALGFTDNGPSNNGGHVFSFTHPSSAFANAWAFNNGSWRSKAYSAVTQAGRWYHLVSAVSSTTDWRIYKDGRVDGAPASLGSVTTTKMAHLGLGAQPTVGINSPLACQLFDVRVYDATRVGDVDAFVASLYDPATRWSLFRGNERTYFIPAAAGGATNLPAISHYYRTMRAA